MGLLCPDKIYPKGVGNNDVFGTPQGLYDQLNAIFNFTLDAACTRANCKAPNGFYFDEGINALQMSWANERVFCNPPFSLKDKFIEKAYDEVIGGKCPIVVMILPLSCQSTQAFQKYIKKHFFFETLLGRIQFINTDTQKPMPGNPTGTTIVYFKRDISR